MNDRPNMLLEAENLHRTFRLGRAEVRALRGASLSVREGDRVSIMGASGAGKSTLLQILGGLEPPTAGTVKFRDKDLYRLSSRALCDYRARDVGFVFQSYHLLPELEVLDNIMLPALGRRGAIARHRVLMERAAMLAESVGLTERVRHLPAELSGGECQRVALARALMNDPSVILADEPTGNLDSGTGGHVLDLLFGLVERQGKTLVMVTHDPAVAERCERRLHLRDGVFHAA